MPTTKRTTKTAAPSKPITAAEAEAAGRLAYEKVVNAATESSDAPKPHRRKTDVRTDRSTGRSIDPEILLAMFRKSEEGYR
jgi:hypothetical protein